MATYYDELLRRAQSAQGVGMNPTNQGTQRTGGNQASGGQSTARTGRQGSAQELAQGTQAFVPGVAPRTRTTAPSGPASRVQRALSIYRGADTARATAEAGVNPEIAEQTRLNLIRQERIQKNLQGGGMPMNPVEYRAALREAQVNQDAVATGVQGVNAMREANILARGQDVESATTLADREMAEIGAFDRAQTNLDVADLQGQYGLGRAFLEGSMRRDAVVAGRQTLNPLEAARLRLGAGIEQGIAGLPEEQQAGRYAAVMDAYAGQPLAPAFAPNMQTVTLADGSEIELSSERALGIAALRDPAVRTMLEAEGYVVGEDGALTRVTGQGGATPGNGRQVTTDAGGTTATAERAAPVPVTFQSAPAAGGVGATPQRVAGLPAGVMNPGGGRSVSAEQRAQREAQAAAAQIGDILANGFEEGPESAARKSVFARQYGPYIGRLPESQQRQMYQQLGDSVLPYLTIDVAGGN